MANQRDRKSVAARSGSAQLASKDPRAGETEAAGGPARPQTPAVELADGTNLLPSGRSRDATGRFRRPSGRPEADQIGRRPSDQQSMMEPVGVVQPLR